MDFEKLLRQKGKCCITGKPLKDSKHINIIQLHMKASWEFPVWGNVITGERNMAIAYAHDEAIVNGILSGPVQFMIETRKGEIIYHPIRTCRQCGCREDDACIHPVHGNCSWVEEDLCSHCKNYPGESKRYSVLKAEKRNAIN
jgi:hypothetical protein